MPFDWRDDKSPCAVMLAQVLSHVRAYFEPNHARTSPAPPQRVHERYRLDRIELQIFLVPLHRGHRVRLCRKTLRPTNQTAPMATAATSS